MTSNHVVSKVYLLSGEEKLGFAGRVLREGTRLEMLTTRKGKRVWLQVRVERTRGGIGILSAETGSVVSNLTADHRMKRKAFYALPKATMPRAIITFG